jgi:hypothetical protein
MFLLSYWLLQKQQVQDRPHLYYVLWFNLMNIANLFDYIPFRTFTPVNWDTDMSNLERGLNISPWVVYVVGGYLVMFVNLAVLFENARGVLCLSRSESSLDQVLSINLRSPCSVWIFQLSRIAWIWRNIGVPINDVSVDLSGDHRLLLAGQTMGPGKDGRD